MICDNRDDDNDDGYNDYWWFLKIGMMTKMMMTKVMTTMIRDNEEDDDSVNGSNDGYNDDNRISILPSIPSPTVVSFEVINQPMAPTLAAAIARL